MKRKFKNRRGESFIETIAAMLIICLGMLMLAGSIVTAARVNKRASSETIQVVPPDPSKYPVRWDMPLNGKVKISEVGNETNNTSELSIALYKAKPEGGGDDEKQVLYYYEIAP